MYISEKITEYYIIKSVKDKILTKTYGCGRGNVVNASDFLTKFNLFYTFRS